MVLAGFGSFWVVPCFSNYEIMDLSTRLRGINIVQPVELHETRHRDKISLYNYKNICSHKDTCRCNISLRKVPGIFSSVCTCCDFVPATCSRYSPSYMSPHCRLNKFFVAATCP